MTFLLCVAEKVLDGLFQHPARLKNASLLPLDFLSAFICGFTVALPFDFLICVHLWFRRCSPENCFFLRASAPLR